MLVGFEVSCGSDILVSSHMLFLVDSGPATWKEMLLFWALRLTDSLVKITEHWRKKKKIFQVLNVCVCTFRFL